jgi:hypothetical protein
MIFFLRRTNKSSSSSTTRYAACLLFFMPHACRAPATANGRPPLHPAASVTPSSKCGLGLFSLFMICCRVMHGGAPARTTTNSAATTPRFFCRCVARLNFLLLAARLLKNETVMANERVSSSSRHRCGSIDLSSRLINIFRSTSTGREEEPVVASATEYVCTYVSLSPYVGAAICTVLVCCASLRVYGRGFKMLPATKKRFVDHPPDDITRSFAPSFSDIASGCREGEAEQR